MSNTILNDHLWTDEEVAYKLSRSLNKEVEANRKLFGPGGELEGQDLSAPEPEDVVLELDRDVYEHVIGLDIPGLQQDLKQHGLSSKGTEHELRSRLAQALQAKRDDHSNT